MFRRLWLSLIVGMTCVGTPVQAEPVYDWNWVVPPGVFPSNQTPTIAELPDGALIACWPGGSAQKARDVQIYCSSYRSGAPAWDEPRVVVRRGEQTRGSLLANLTLGNPVLFLDHERSLWLFYVAVDVPLGWSGSHVDYKVSRDLGKSWAPARRLVSTYGTMAKNKPLVLAPNRILLPLYHELFGTHGSILQLAVNDGEVETTGSWRIPGGGHIQPSLVMTTQNRLVAYLRPTRESVPHVLFSEYDPEQDRWSEPTALDVPNPRSAIDVVKTEDGKILLAYNDTTNLRSPLSLAYSEDGRQFTKLWDLENQPGKRFSYPALIRGLDSTYHVVYKCDASGDTTAIKHVWFNRQWLEMRIDAIRGH